MHLLTSLGRSHLLPSERQKNCSTILRIQRFRSRSNWKGIATAGCDSQTTSVRESRLSTPKGRPHSRADKWPECWAPEERRSESHQTHGIPPNSLANHCGGRLWVCETLCRWRDFSDQITQ